MHFFHSRDSRIVVKRLVSPLVLAHLLKTAAIAQWGILAKTLEKSNV